MAETKPTLYKYQLENGKNTYATLTNGKFTVRNSPNVNEYTLSNLGKRNSMNAAQAAAQAAPVEPVANASNQAASNKAASNQAAANKAAANKAASNPTGTVNTTLPVVSSNPSANTAEKTVKVETDDGRYTVLVKKNNVNTVSGGKRRTHHKKHNASRKQKRSTRTKRKQNKRK